MTIQCDEQLRSRHIEASRFTLGWLVDILSSKDEKWQKFSNGKKLLDFTAVNISGGKGFASRILKVSLIFDNNAGQYDIVMKVPGAEAFQHETKKEEYGNKTELKESAEMMIVMEKNHEKECNFYQNSQHTPGLPLLRVFHTEKWDSTAKIDGVIVMECVSETAVNEEFFNGFNVKQLEKLALAVANLQAESLLRKDKAWIDEMEIFQITDTKVMDLMIGMTEATTKKRPEYFEKNFPKFKSLFRNMNFWYDMSQLYKKLDMTPVMAHGDFWMNNLMWKKNSDGSASNELVAVIDWQITHSGCCGEDLARALMLCTEGDTRRQYEMDIIKLYYSTLTQLLKQGGMTEPPFTFEQVVKAYQVCSIYQMAQLISGVAFITNAQPPDTDAKLKAEREEKLLMRAKMALEDATEYAEKLFPEILDSV